LTSIALLMLVAIACRAQKETDRAAGAEVQSISLPAFDAIDNESAVRLYITQGNSRSVKVRHAAGWRLKLSVRGNTLRLETEKPSRQQNNYAEVWITMPSLKSINNDGAIHIDARNFNGKKLNIDNDGAMTLKAEQTSLRDFDMHQRRCADRHPRY